MLQCRIYLKKKKLLGKIIFSQSKPVLSNELMDLEAKTSIEKKIKEHNLH